MSEKNGSEKIQINSWLVSTGHQDVASIIRNDHEISYKHTSNSNGCGVDEIDEQDIADMYRDGCDENLIAYEHSMSLTHVRYVLFKLGLIDSMPKKRSVGRAKRPVIQMTKDGSIIRSHESIKQASIDSGVTLTNIALTCAGKRNSAGGFKWEYMNV